MGIELFATGLYLDSDLEDGYVQVATTDGDYEPTIFMSSRTHWALLVAAKLADVWEYMLVQSDGTYLLPRSILESDAAADLEHAIEYADLRPADGCVMPGCIQDVVDTSRGFSLCANHHELLQGWDSLVA